MGRKTFLFPEEIANSCEEFPSFNPYDNCNDIHILHGWNEIPGYEIKMNKIFLLAIMGIIAVFISMQIARGFWKPENAVTYPDCVEPLLNGFAYLLHPECGQEAMKANWEYFKGLGFIYSDNKTDGTILLDRYPIPDTIRESPIPNETKPIEPHVSAEQDKPYKDCLADTSKTYVECQELNPRN